MAYPLTNPYGTTTAVPPYKPNWTMPPKEPLGPGPASAAPTPKAPVSPTTVLGAEEATRSGRIASRAGNLVGRGLRALGPAAGGAAVASGLGDYRIDDPSVDSSAMGTLRAVGQGDFAGAGRSLSKGALEAGMDLGSSAAKTADFFLPGTPAQTAYGNFLRGQFGDQLIGPAGSAPAAGPAAASGPRMALPPGMTPSTAGAGRGLVDHPLRTDMDPGRMSLGPSRDFTRELGTVPAELPGDIRPGVVLKTRGANGETVYSGRNVSSGATIVDGMGRSTGTLRDGLSPSGSPPGRSAADIELAAAVIDRNNSVLRRQLDAYGPGMHDADGNPGSGGFRAGTLFDNVREIAGAQGSRGSRAPTRAERIAENEIASRREIANMQTAATLRGQDITGRGQDLSFASARAGHAVTARGQDLDAGTRVGLKQMDLAAQQAQRSAATRALMMAGGDYTRAAGLYAGMGYDPAGFKSVADAQRSDLDQSGKNLREMLEGTAVVKDKNGMDVVSPGLAAAGRNTVVTAMPGVANAPAAVQNSHVRDVQAVGNLSAGLNSGQGGSLLQSVGWDKAPPAMDALPPMKGGSLREVGVTDVTPFTNASRGDYLLRSPDGKAYPIKRDKVGQKELDYLKSQGVDLRALGN